MTNWERLEKVIQYFGLNVNSFARELGIKRAERLYQIKKGNYAISKNLAAIIVERFPEISDVWLLTGDGNMTRIGGEIVKIPLYNISLDELKADTESLPIADYLSIPLLSSSDFAFVNQGDAMSPEAEHGSVVFVKQVDMESVVYGDIYLVLSERMNIVRFIRGLDDNSWRLVAKNNTDYDDITLDKSTVTAVYKVKGVLSMISM